MILAFSTSSRWASVAAIHESGAILWSGELEAPQSAGIACIRLVDQCSTDLSFSPGDADAFAADLGPGSFTGLRVAITLAKTFGFIFGRECLGASAFDLVDPAGIVVLPSKRGEVFIRRPGSELERSSVAPEGDFRGYGLPGMREEYPHARGFGRLAQGLVPVKPQFLLPEYHIDPSISTPKRPFGSSST